MTVRALSPAGVFPWTLWVDWEDTDASRACMTIGQQARHGTDPGGEHLCEASIRIGWVLANSFKPTRIPLSIVKALS